MELSTLTYPQVVYDGAVTRVDLDAWHSDLEELDLLTFPWVISGREVRD